MKNKTGKIRAYLHSLYEVVQTPYALTALIGSIIYALGVVGKAFDFPGRLPIWEISLLVGITLLVAGAISAIIGLILQNRRLKKSNAKLEKQASRVRGANTLWLGIARHFAETHSYYWRHQDVIGKHAHQDMRWMLGIIDRFQFLLQHLCKQRFAVSVKVAIPSPKSRMQWEVITIGRDSKSREYRQKRGREHTIVEGNTDFEQIVVNRDAIYIEDHISESDFRTTRNYSDYDAILTLQLPIDELKGNFDTEDDPVFMLSIDTTTASFSSGELVHYAAEISWLLSVGMFVREYDKPQSLRRVLGEIPNVFSIFSNPSFKPRK